MISSGRPSNDIKEVLSVTTEVDIASYYLGISSIPVVINSPLRMDNNPSFGIFSPDGVKVKYIDFSTKDNGDIFTLLMKMWRTSLNEVCGRIYRDFSKFKGGVNVTKSVPTCQVSGIGKHSDSELKCKIRDWRSYDVEYWASYGVPLEWLKYAEVYPISHKIVVKSGNRMVFGADKYAYAYVEHKDGETTLKIYQPFNKTGFKWANKHDRSVISLWTKVPEYGDRICICSSLKDALCLWANTGIPAIAIQGEGYGISDTAVGELRRRYKNVYILLDNDEAGVQDALKLSESTGFTNLVLPKEYNAKDISDLYLALKDKEKFTQIIKGLFKETF